jgi:hypothetical protein
MYKYAFILPILFLSPLMADVVTVSPDKLDFGSQPLGVFAWGQAVLSNPTKKALNISTIVAGGDFVVFSQDCGSVLLPGNQCNIYVQLLTNSLGAKTNTLTISDDANSSPQKVKLSGTVIPLQLVSINVTPAVISTPVGRAQQFTATGVFNSGAQQDLTNTATWASSDPSIAHMSANGLFSALNQGAATISATQSGFTGSAQFTATAPVVVSIHVMPANVSIPKGVKQQLAAFGAFSDNTFGDLTTTVQWSSSETSVASVTSAGLVSGLNPGQVTIRATSANATASTSVSVTPPVVTSIKVSPTNFSMGSFTPHQFTAIGTFSDSSTSDVTSLVSWTSTNGNVVGVSAGGQIFAGSLGAATLTAQISNGRDINVMQTATLETAFQSFGHSVMTSPRAGHASALLNDGRVLLTGGVDGSTQTVSSTDIFDPRIFQFTHGPPMSAPRVTHTATTLPGGQVLIAGGGPITAELFDPLAGVFVPTGDLNVSRSGHTATLLQNGQVLIVGGNSNTAEIYDPATGLFTRTGAMAIPRTGHTATLLRNGGVLIAGGSSSTLLEVYDRFTGVFTPAGTLSTDRTNHAASLLADGNVLLMGGKSGSGYTSSADLYNPDTGTITAVPPMRFARAFHTATLLSNGQVLVAGGFGGSFFGGPDTTVERFDPTSGTFAGSGDMATYGTSGARVYHTATLLQNGQVLLAGSIPGGPDFPYGTAEIYQPSMPNPPGLQ